MNIKPKPIKEYLDQIVHVNGMDTIVGDVCIDDPDMKFQGVYINGSFINRCEELSSLEGSPEIVEGKFIVYETKIRNLIGMPKSVGNLIAHYCELETFEGLGEVRGSIDVDNNNIDSLKYLPETIIGNFEIQFNALKNLKYAPKKIYGNVDLSHNMLTDISNLPEYIGGYLALEDNRDLRSLKGLHSNVGKDIFINDFQLDKTLDSLMELLLIDKLKIWGYSSF